MQSWIRIWNDLTTALHVVNLSRLRKVYRSSVCLKFLSAGTLPYVRNNSICTWRFFYPGTYPWDQAVFKPRIKLHLCGFTSGLQKSHGVPFKDVRKGKQQFKLCKASLVLNLFLTCRSFNNWLVEHFHFVHCSAPDPWHVGTDPDRRICTLPLTNDPATDPAFFVSDLQDANKKEFLLTLFWLFTFWRYIYIILQR